MPNTTATLWETHPPDRKGRATIRAVSLRSASGLLLALLIFGATGCLTGPTNRSDESPALAGDVQTTNSIPEAYFVLQASHLRASNWPSAYVNTKVFICNPSIPPADVQKIRQDIPGSIALGYVNLQDLQFDLYPESPYWTEFAERFPTYLCVRDRPTGTVIRVQGYTGVPGSGLMHAIPHQRNLEILVRFHVDVTMAAGFDGLYLDQSNKVYPPWRRASVQSQSSNFDCDGDGFADTADQLATKWANGRATLTTRLRQELPTKIIIANSGGLLSDHNLNGITLEGIGKRFTLAQAQSYLVAQKLVSRQPFVAVGWVTSVECVTATQTIVSLIPGTHYGKVPQFVH